MGDDKCAGVCVGGPWAGRWHDAPTSTWRMASWDETHPDLVAAEVGTYHWSTMWGEPGFWIWQRLGAGDPNPINAIMRELLTNYRPLVGNEVW